MDIITIPISTIYNSIFSNIGTPTDGNTVISSVDNILSYFGLSFSSQSNESITKIDRFFKILIGIYILYFGLTYKESSFKKASTEITFLIFGIFLMRSFLVYILVDYKPDTQIKQKNIIHEIILNEFKFQPVEIKIKRNDIVRFINMDDVRHSISFMDERIDNTPILKQGDSFMIRFKDLGEYQFKSIYTESNSVGKVIVEE
jgi:plastocyanin